MGAIELCTSGDGADVGRIADALAAERPPVVIAAGGDGTLRDVVQAVYEARLRGLSDPPAIAVVPLGTANNVARALGFMTARRDAGIELTERALAAGCERRIDLGIANGRCFVGSLAAGMDADILESRNRWRERLGIRSGYALYLACCALNTFRRHGAPASVSIDGAALAERRIYNLLVLNTPIYAGEFRFSADDPSADGRLDLHVFRDALDYLGRYPVAWRRHVRHQRGVHVRPPRRMVRFAELAVELAAPLAWQLDGEPMPPTNRLEVRVLPGALRMIVPAVHELPLGSPLG